MKWNYPIILLVFILFNSCNAIKQAKDNKAVGRVLSNPSLTDRVYQVAVGLHPIVPNNVYIKGKDSLIVDSIPYLVVQVDSIIKTECPSLNLDSLKELLRRDYYHIRVDTVQRDNPAMAQLVNSITGNNNYLHGELDALYKQLGTVQHKADVRLWIIIGVSTLGIIIIGLLLYFLIKGKGLLTGKL